MAQEKLLTESQAAMVELMLSTRNPELPLMFGKTAKEIAEGIQRREQWAVMIALDVMQVSFDFIRRAHHRVEETDACEVHPFSSRICERGTNSCVVVHTHP